MNAPFRPAPDDFGGFDMPASVPDGLELQLSRAPLLEATEAALDDWMNMLHERYDECLAALPSERAVFEATFTHTEADGSLWLYHLSLVGKDSPGLDTSTPIGQAHQEHAMRTKRRGWEELRPQFMITPEHLAEAMQHWGRTGRR